MYFEEKKIFWFTYSIHTTNSKIVKIIVRLVSSIVYLFQKPVLILLLYVQTSWNLVSRLLLPFMDFQFHLSALAFAFAILRI